MFVVHYLPKFTPASSPTVLSLYPSWLAENLLQLYQDQQFRKHNKDETITTPVGGCIVSFLLYHSLFLFKYMWTILIFSKYRIFIPPVLQEPLLFLDCAVTKNTLKTVNENT
ncbi:unnamed protein product [Ilex paraguariensis]|uniref:Uncharacterized protein n=1 Tax=Ilex paraguariensis TaxID=185542 RepID=A0ABC8UB02_9AQUA